MDLVVVKNPLLIRVHPWNPWFILCFHIESSSIQNLHSHGRASWFVFGRDSALVALVKKLLIWMGGCVLPCLGFSQEVDLLKGEALEAFREVESWRGVNGVKAVEGKGEFELEGEGKILVNVAKRGEKAPFLMTKEEYGDVRIQLEFMVPKNSNAGVYVAGRYEVQILDSWGRQRFGSGDLGGVYERWDESRGKGKEGFAGIAPKENASKPPGEWQTMEIVFRAPKFDETGKKYRDATFEKVLVNGVLVQENASTGGHTRSAPFEGDAAKGPIAIQGDHGPLAIRAYKVTPLEDADVVRIRELDAYWAEVSRAVGAGDFEAYKATCHEKAVYVTGIKKVSYPLAQALARWKREFDDTKAGKMQASVEFRFAERFGDAVTAHESGVFRYTQKVEGEEMKEEFVDFEALMVKEGGKWQIFMEFQKATVGKDKWDALAE